MKTSLKRIFSALLVVVLAAGIFIATPAEAEAASKLSYNKKITIYLMTTSGAGFEDIKVKTSKTVKSVKSSNKSVAGDLSVEKHKTYSLISVVGKKAGTAKITFKVGGKKYTTKVTVKNYTNPIKTLKISGVGGGKNIASKVKKKNEVDLSLKKNITNAKLTIKTAKNWKLTDISFYDGTVGDSKVDKTYSKGTSKKKSYKLKKLKKSHSYYLCMDFKNKKNGGVQHIYYNINSNYKYAAP